MALEDITKTGPVGLRGIKGIDKINEMSDEEYNEFVSSFKAPSKQAIQLQGALSMGKDFEIATGQNIGDSKYDKSVFSIDEVSNISEYRAYEQPWYEQIGAGLAKGVVLAGTTFLDGTVGTVVGAANAISEGKFSAFWDNPFARAMKEVNDWSEEALPNYYSQEEQMNDANGEWYKNVFTANWWGDKFIKNLGFTAGAFATGNVVSSILGKAPGIVKSVVGATVSAINEGKVEALNNSDEWYKFEKQKIDDKFRAQYEILQQYSNEPRIYNGLLEATNSQYEAALAKLNEDKAKVGNVDLALNLPILMASNMYMWGKLYAGGSKTAISNMNIAKRNGKYISQSTPFKAFTGFLSEGTEEISQKAAATIPGLKYGSELEEFYMSRWDPEANTEVLNWTKSFAKGIADTVGDPSSWEEFTIGALTGALGMPTFRSTTTEDGKRQIPITIRGGIIGDYREYREQKDRENSMVNMLNERVSSSEFQNYYEGMIRHAKYQNDMNEAAELGDEYSYKNAEDSQLISDIIMFDKAGRLNDIVEMIEGASDLSDENIQSIIDNTTDADGNGPFSQNGNALPREEIINKINERKDIILKQIGDYRKLKDVINREIGDKISDSQLEELTWLLSKSRRNSDRIGELSKDVNRVLRSALAEAEQQMPNETQLLENLRNLVDASPEELAFILKSNPEVVQLIKEYAEGVDNKYNLNYTEEANKIDDIVKLYSTIQEFNKKYKEYTENTAKQAEDNTKAKDKAAKTNKASEDIKKKDDIVNKSVSEINEAIDNGEMTEDDLLAMFPDGLPSKEEMSEVESKAKSALDIRDKTSKIKAEIDKSDADETTKNNAKKLIDNSKLLSDSLDDLTDLSSEAFNDPSFMYDELDPSLQGLDREALQDEVEIRLGGAKNLLSEMISIVEDNEGKLDNIPDFIPDETKESSIESTGHDSIDKNEPINKPKAVKTIKGTLADNLIQQAIDESNDSPIVMTLRDVIKDIDRLVNAGAVEKTIKKTIYDSASYKKVVDGFPGLIQAIDNYISNKLEERDNKAPEVKGIKGSEYIPSMEDDVTTVNISVNNLYEYSNNTYKSLDKAEGTGGIYTSWLSPLSKYYRYSPKGDRTTFDQVAEGMNYTPEKLKRVKAIWNYLNNHDVFEYVSSGNVKIGDKIGFAISQTLNNEAGELVVIMLQDNHIVGVLPSENDKEFANYAGLSDFMELLKREYQEAGTPSNFISKYHTSINKIMIGRVPYTSNDNTTTLNNIFTETTSDGGTKEMPIELGISSGDGRNAEMIISSVRKGTSRSIKDKQRTIMSPLNAKKGQPYLLVKTSDPNRAYISVPFSMPYYSQDTSDSALGIAIDNVLNSLVGLQPKDVMKAKREIQELLAIPELHINILKNGNLKIDAKFQGDDKQTNIYNGRQDNPNLVQEVKSKLYGTPFQVSRKYINDTYKGQDYNRMIGELAYTNIDGTHTIDDWFTINPIDKEGNEFKGKTFKSIRTNPNSAKPQVFEYNWKGIPLKVDLNTFEVRDSEGNLKEGKNADIVKALAYGFKNNKSGTYNTSWGWFNSETLEFVDDPKSENVIKKTLKSGEEKDTNIKLSDDYWRNSANFDSKFKIIANNFDTFKVLWNEYKKGLSEEEFNIRAGSRATIVKEFFKMYDSETSNVENTPSRPEASSTFATPEQLEDQAKKKGLLGTSKRKELWKALDNSQQETILNTKGLRQKQLIDGLDRAFNVSNKKFDLSKLEGSIEKYLGMKPLYRRVTESKEQIRDKEIKWLSKVLPNLSEEDRIKVVEGLIEISEEDGGGFAWGQFKQGIITISNLAARGTVYHEAFHAVTHTLLNDSEYDELFKAGREKYGDLSEIEVEEKLAEDFRRYMQLEEMPFVGRIVKIFRNLKHIIQNLLGNEPYLNKLYYSINNGVYSNREVTQTNIIRNREYIPYQILEMELDDFMYQYAKAHHPNLKSFLNKNFDSREAAQAEIDGMKLSDVCYVYSLSNGKHTISSISREKYNNTVREMKRDIQISKYYGKSYYRRVEQHHREKYMIGNLSNEDKQFLKDKGISIEEYNRMSPFEREVLFHCR